MLFRCPYDLTLIVRCSESWSVVLNIRLDNIVSEDFYELTLVAQRSSEYVDCLGFHFCYVICIGKFSILSSVDVADVCLECLLARGLERR